MANLIITIISIALVAVAALMSAYYGGQAYQNAQAKAKANEIINSANQIASAVQVWKTSTLKTDQSYPHWNPPVSSTLIPSYLTSIPVIRLDTNTYLNFLKYNTMGNVGFLINPLFGGGNGSTSSEGDLTGSARLLGLYLTVSSSPPSRVCEEINRISTGNPTAVVIAGIWNTGGTQTPATVFGSYKFRCILDDDFIPGTEYFVYRFN